MADVDEKSAAPSEAMMLWKDKEITVRVRDLAWIAERVHQGYHTDHPGFYESCPKGVCSFITTLLIEKAPKEDATNG